MNYITRIQLNKELLQTKLALSNREVMHGIVERSFPEGDKTRHLWKVDDLNKNTYLYIVSKENKPNLDLIVSQIGFGAKETPIIKEYDKRIDGVEIGKPYQFKLVATPTIKKNGKVMPHITYKHKMNWLHRKAENNGFALTDAEIVKDIDLHFRKNSNEGSAIREVDFIGELVVTDKEKFQNVLLNGLGRSKAYGMGFMEVMPI